MDNPFNEDQGSEDLVPQPLAPAGNISPRKSEDRSSVITARGTSEGLVLRVDGRVEAGDMLASVREFLESRRSFLSGNDIAFEWIGQRPDE
jgi:hypothetical protein